jgi:hypothetical protein
MSNQNKNKSNKPAQTMDEKVSNVTNMITDAEARTLTLTLSCNVNGFHKTGTFKAKYPSITDRIAIGSLRAKLLDGAPSRSVDNFTDNLSFIVAYLNVLLVKKPGWFDMSTMDDVSVVDELYTEVAKWVDNFRLSTQRGEDVGHSDTATDETNMESNEAVSSSD